MLRYVKPHYLLAVLCIAAFLGGCAQGKLNAKPFECKPCLTASK